jgi:hypothetical protein
MRERQKDLKRYLDALTSPLPAALDCREHECRLCRACLKAKNVHGTAQTSNVLA